MKLSEMPEGVKTEARIEGETETFHMTVRDGTAYYPSGMRSTVKPSCWTVVEPDELATLRTRIAELEAALAKATSPAPAVGQVWKRDSLSEYLIVDCGYLYPDGVVIDAGMPTEYTASDTYVGIWTGEFPVKGSAE